MATGNMGIKKKDLDDKSPLTEMLAGPVSDAAKEEGEKLSYPKFTLTNKHIEAAGLTGVNPDDVVTFTVKARVETTSKKSPNSATYRDNEVGLEVQDISNVNVTGTGSDDESDEDKDFKGQMGFAKKDTRTGGGNLSPKKAGVKL